jgi:glycosyltransferase involved in cell wall biosynthesis
MTGSGSTVERVRIEPERQVRPSLTAPLGVSVVICTHNGAKRLPSTLAHLRAQQVPEEIDWEILLIDNESTDDTAEVASKCWPGDAPAQLRIVREPQIGLSYARARAFAEARYELISFVDDDNWVNRDWVKVASEVMSGDPQIGAVGGVNEAVAEVAFPAWFDHYAGFYAVLREREFALLGVPPRRLIGAGLTIRKAAWRKLLDEGFRSWLSDRVGSRLSGGGDTELTGALLLNGWKLELEPRLRLQHFMPAKRLDWGYLRRIVRGYAASHVALEAYHIGGEKASQARSRFAGTWLWHLLGTAKALMVSPRRLIAWLSSKEGDRETLEAEEMLGRIIGFATLRGRYREIEQDVRHARWRLKSES